jgi:regulator of replication initiation timing
LGGGQNNTVTGDSSCVVGGRNNNASGSDSFAAGTGSSAAHQYTFVWSDSTPRSSKSSGEFVVGCSGGAVFYTSASPSIGVTLAPGGVSWTTISDRNLKENLVELDGKEVLAKVDLLPVFQYNFIGQPLDILYRGPVAQDWHTLFPSGKNKLGIDTVDTTGIALAAIKGLSLNAKSLAKQFDLIENENQALRSRIDNLVAENSTMVGRLEKENQELRGRIDKLVAENLATVGRLETQNLAFRGHVDDLVTENLAMAARLEAIEQRLAAFGV